MITRLQLLWLFLFLVANYLLSILHVQVFQSAWPLAVWGSLSMHLIVLLFFPYSLFFKQPK